MRIGFDAKRAFNNHRGLGNYSRDTIRIMSTSFPENEHFLFTPKIDPNIHFDCPENAKIILPNNGFDKVFSTLWRSFGMVPDIKENKLDIFHGLSHELPWGIEKTRTRSVVTMHDLIFIKQPELYPAFDRKMYKIKYFHSCRIADKVVAISEQTKHDLIELAGIDATKIQVIYQGCNPIFHHKCSADEKRDVRVKYNLPKHFILNVAAIEKRKNQLTILKSLVSNNIDFPIVFIGKETDYAKTLRAFIEKNKLQSRVFLLHNVDFKDFPAIYQSASLFIYPSTSEGFGIPIIEALQSGIPVIASNEACLMESGGPGSRYVSPTDEADLGYAISQILSDSTMQEKMVLEGMKHVAQFSDAAIAKSLMDVYLSLQ